MLSIKEYIKTIIRNKCNQKFLKRRRKREGTI
jgi:hypothetical protein